MLSDVSAHDPATNALPDLQISNVYLEQDTNQVIMLIANVGLADVPAGQGSLSLFVDHLKVTDIAFADISDQTFRSVGGSSLVNTGIHLAGAGRRIIAVVDSRSEILEADEYQNVMSFQIDPPLKNGFDLQLIAAVNAQQELYFELNNLGNQPSPANLDLSFSIYANGSLVQTYVQTIPSVAVDAQYILNPAQTLTIPEPTEIRTSFQVASAADIDDSNNVFEAKLHHVTLADILTMYNDLLTHPKIEPNLFFSGDPALGHNTSYSSWPQSMRDRLHEFLLLLEQGRELPLPPPLYTVYVAEGGSVHDDAFLPVDSAVEYFLAHVAQCMWFDKNGGTLWRLTDLSEEHIDYLFRSNRYLWYLSFFDISIPQYSYIASVVEGASASWNPRLLYHFMKHLGIIRPTQEETVFALTDWYRAHVAHVSSGEGGPFAELDFGAKGWIHTDRVAYPLASGALKHVQYGCHGCAGWYEATLRTLNIPVIYEKIDLSLNGHVRNGHGSFKMPTVRKTPADSPGIRVWHADDLYNQLLLPWGSHGMAPSNRVFLSYEEAAALLEAPLDLDTDPLTGETNTESEQALQNLGRYYALLAREFLSRQYLWEYGVKGPEYVDGTMQYSRRGGQPDPTALPFLNAAQRQEFLDALLVEITQLGGGDFDAGVSEIGTLRLAMLENRVPSPYDPDALRITTVHTRLATEGNAYSDFMSAAGGSGTGYGWNIVSGALPPGITLPSGIWATLSGTPTAEGRFDFTIQVTDSAGNVATRTTYMVVAQQRLIVSTVTLPDAIQGAPYSHEVTGQGGSGSGYQWTPSGAVPPGLSIAPAGTPSTPLSGTPTEAGTFAFGVLLTDDDNNTYFRSLILNVMPCKYGDVNIDGVVNTKDILCVLDAFEGLSSCSFDGADINPCGGDGLIDADDILAVLDAFRGIPTCAAPCQ